MAAAREKPAVESADVTPSDSTTYKATRGIWVGVTGNLNVQFYKDSGPRLLVGVQAGSLLPISVTQVLATATTATDIVALW